MSAFVNLISRWDDRGVRAANKSLETSSQKFKDFGNKAGLVFAGVAAAGLKFAKAAAQDEQAQIRLATALKNTVNATDKQIASTEDWIKKTSLATGVVDDQLRAGVNRLTQSTKDLSEAQKLSNLALDISSATGKDYESVVAALARANDGSVTSLKKLGITLGENANNYAEQVKLQKDLAKAQADAALAEKEHGKGSKEYQAALKDVKETQKELNQVTQAGVDWQGELAKTFKGQSEKAANTTAGKMKRLNVAMQEAQESIGVGLLPILESLTDIMGKLAPWIEENADWLSKLVIVVGAISGAFFLASKALAAYEIVQKIVTIATAEQTAAQWALNTAWLANPITWVVAGVIALIAAFVLLYKNSETVRKYVDAAFEGIKNAILTVWNWVSENFPKIFEFLSKPFKLWFELVKTVWSKIFEFFKGMPEKLKSAVSTVGGALISPFKTAFNTIADLWNNTLGKFKFEIPDWVPGIGGKGWGFPKIPKLAQGGIVTKPTLALIGEAGPEAVVPLKNRGMGNVNITINGAIDAEGTARQIRQILRRSELRAGAF